MYDLVIRNGKLVTEKGVIDADLAVLGGKIANIVPRSQAPGTDVLG